MLKTTNLKLQFLGIIPTLHDSTGSLTPEQIVALSALLTFKGKSVKALLTETIDKGQDLKKKVAVILNKSSLRGHASIATTPALAFAYESSKFLDSLLTGITFSSSLMASGRRTDSDIADIVYPSSILKNTRARAIFTKQSTQNINVYRWFIAQGIAKDEASKILQYGIYGTGIIVLPVESIAGFLREYELEKSWMPEEAKLIAQYFMRNCDKWGIGQLLPTRLAAPRDIYPYPNIFRDPQNASLVRNFAGEDRLKATSPASRVLSAEITPTAELRQKLKLLKRLTGQITTNKNKLIRDWPKLVSLRREICRDYNLAATIRVLSHPAWRVWGEKKRHRTVPQCVESIYYCINRTKNIKNQISKIKNKYQKSKILNSYFSLPPSAIKNPQYMQKFADCVLGSLDSYQKLVKMGIPPADALFVMPRSLRLDVLQDYNLYNLISGYYPTRLCATVEESLLKDTRIEVALIKKLLVKAKFRELAEVIQPKCHLTGFCHEEVSCGQIKGLVKDYDDKFHKKILLSLEKRAKNVLS